MLRPENTLRRLLKRARVCANPRTHNNEPDETDADAVDLFNNRKLFRYGFNIQSVLQAEIVWTRTRFIRPIFSPLALSFVFISLVSAISGVSDFDNFTISVAFFSLETAS